jgi:hypothetical protein
LKTALGDAEERAIHQPAKNGSYIQANPWWWVDDSPTPEHNPQMGRWYTRHDEDGCGVVCFDCIIDRIEMGWPEESDLPNSENEWKWVASAALTSLQMAMARVPLRRSTADERPGCVHIEAMRAPRLTASHKRTRRLQGHYSCRHCGGKEQVNS